MQKKAAAFFYEVIPNRIHFNRGEFLLNRKILRLAIPNIVSNLTIPLVGLVDTWLMGHLSDSIYIGAVALGSVIFMFLYSVFGFLRASTTGFAAQQYGARRLDETIAVLGQGMFVALAGAALLLLLQSPLKQWSFQWMEGSPDVEELAGAYFSIRIWAAPAALANYVLSGWFIGMQNARSPMVVALVVNLLNIAFSMFFVLQGGMQSNGVALGTVVAQYGGLITAFFMFFRYYRKLLKYWSLNLIMRLERFKLFFRVNKDILIRSVLLTGTFFYFTTYSAKLGDNILNINSLMLQFLWILSYFIDGFAYAAESLVGRAYGAGSSRMLRQVVLRIFIISGFLSALFSLLYGFFYLDLFSVLTDKIDLLEQVRQYRWWIWLMPVISFAAFVWDGIYIGALASVALRNSMIVSSLFVFLPVIYASPRSFGNHGLWLALLGFLLARGLMLSFLYRKSVLLPLERP